MPRGTILNTDQLRSIELNKQKRNKAFVIYCATIALSVLADKFDHKRLSQSFSLLSGPALVATAHFYNEALESMNSPQKVTSEHSGLIDDQNRQIPVSQTTNQQAIINQLDQLYQLPAFEKNSFSS
jgi:hypothetical protein